MGILYVGRTRALVPRPLIARTVTEPRVAASSRHVQPKAIARSGKRSHYKR